MAEWLPRRRITKGWSCVALWRRRRGRLAYPATPSGLGLRVLTDQPGVILYTGQYNSSGGEHMGGRGGR